jgi:hypothetical protein
MVFESTSFAVADGSDRKLTLYTPLDEQRTAEKLDSLLYQWQSWNTRSPAWRNPVQSCLNPVWWVAGPRGWKKEADMGRGGIEPPTRGFSAVSRSRQGINQPLAALAWPSPRPTKAQSRHTQSQLGTFLARAAFLNELRYAIQLPIFREKGGAMRPQYAPA